MAFQTLKLRPPTLCMEMFRRLFRTAGLVNGGLPLSHRIRTGSVSFGRGCAPGPPRCRARAAAPRRQLIFSSAVSVSSSAFSACEYTDSKRETKFVSTVMNWPRMPPQLKTVPRSNERTGREDDVEHLAALVVRKLLIL